VFCFPASAGHAALEAAKRPLLISRYISAKASRSVAPAGAAPTADMIRIPGGTFRMGSDRHYPDEAPSHAVTVDGFWIDPTPVTNAQFRAFVQATN
jgi:sulfatase modifying factor 1